MGDCEMEYYLFEVSVTFKTKEVKNFKQWIGAQDGVAACINFSEHIEKIVNICRKNRPDNKLNIPEWESYTIVMKHPYGGGVLSDVNKNQCKIFPLKKFRTKRSPSRKRKNGG